MSISDCTCMNWLSIEYISFQLEQRANEIEQFYLSRSKKQLSASKGSSIVKDKDKEKHMPSIKKQQQDASRREAAAAKRMQELMRQFGTILRQVKNSIYWGLDIFFVSSTFKRKTYANNICM